MAGLVRVSRTFWDDHADRCPLAPGETLAKPLHLSQRYATFDSADRGLRHLYADAVYYADAGNMDECPRSIRDAAQRTAYALRKAGIS